MDFILKNFPLPDEIKLFIEDGLAEEVEKFHENEYSNEVVRIWTIKGTEYSYFMSGIAPIMKAGVVVVKGIMCNWVDGQINLVGPREIFESTEDFEIIRVMVSRPDVYFLHERKNRRFYH